MAPVSEVGDDAASAVQEGTRGSRRSKRAKKESRAGSALEKLRKYHKTGERTKYEVDDVEAVYDIVDEEEYSEIVRRRQEEDWVVDDGVAESYADDGREIFDDDLDEAPPAAQKLAAAKGKKMNVKKSVAKPKTINKMFLAAAKSKKAETDNTSLGDDNVLDDILKEVENPKPAPIRLQRPRPGFPRTPTGAPGTRPRARNGKVGPRSSSLIFSEENIRASGYQPPKRPTSHYMTSAQTHHEQRRQNSKVSSAKPSAVGSEEMMYGGMIGEVMETEDLSLEKDNNVDANRQDDFEQDIGSYENFDDFDDSDMQALDEAEQDSKDSMVEKKATLKDSSSDTRHQPTVKTTELAEGSSWETIIGTEMESSNQQALTDVKVDSSSLPLEDVDGEKVLPFYWFDAYEDPFKQPGTVFLFGKVWIESAKAFVSCCVTVKNIERDIFILPREKRLSSGGSDTAEPVEFMDVYKEFNEKIATKHRIMKFISKRVKKEYAFEIQDVPVQSEYLEVKYSAEFPELPSDLQGDTFSHVFGTNTSSLELFLISRKLKGPGWLNVKGAKIPSNPISWCKVEAIVDKPEMIEVAPEQREPPPLVVMSLNLQTLLNPNSHVHEVLAISAFVHHSVHLDRAAPKERFQYHFCTVSKPSNQMYPYDFKEVVKKTQRNIEVTTSERALLGYFMARVHKIDPDVIVGLDTNGTLGPMLGVYLLQLLGHDIQGFDLDVLLHRINVCKIPHWSRIGRLKRNIMPKLSGGHGRGTSFAERSITCGRMLCDVKISSRELIRCKSYDLTELASTVLQCRRQELDHDEVPNMYNTSQELLNMLEVTSIDALLCLRIMYDLCVLPLALQITSLAGNVMARTLMGGRSERNEFLLLHAFTDKNFICPDKSYSKKPVPVNLDENQDEVSTSRKGRRKPAYAGGLVLEPKKGFYDKYILLLDFNSLYPSIIQEYNICFTTISRTASATGEDEDDLNVDPPDPDLEPGILPTEIRKLVERRRQVKGILKGLSRDSDDYMKYDIRQKALKLTANSMYGCLGFSHSRFYAKPLAALVTSKGREILMKTKDLVQQMNFDVIYGDTDSIMINTNSTDLAEVRKIGNKVKGEVNKLYRLLEIDIDGIFKSMLLLKKKKYAAVAITENEDGTVKEVKEMKGLDIVRRDWCDLAKDTGNYVLGQILSSQLRETIVENIHDFLITVGADVSDGRVDLQKFVINKQLTKSPNDYPDKKSLPHVHVALWLMSKGRKVNVGDTIPYVICEDGSSLPASQRAYHPDEFRKSDTLKIDCKYYLSSQVHPVVSRLCDPIDGTDSAHIAQCLGLDPSGYRGASRHDDEGDAFLGGRAQMTDEERFKDCARFVVKCSECGEGNEFEGVFRTVESSRSEPGSGKVPSGLVCPKCKNTYKAVFLANQLTIAVRRHVKTYYAGWQKCEDPSCDHRTRKVPLSVIRGGPQCPQCGRGHLVTEYSDTALYNQLLYYERLFDVELARKNAKKSNHEGAGVFEFYKTVRSAVDRVLKSNAYSEVNLSKLFSNFFC